MSSTDILDRAPDHMALPAHVPAELVVDVDIFDIPGHREDPQGCWRIFKGKGPLVYSPYNGGHWIATTGEAVFRFFRDPEHFSSAAVAIPDPQADLMLPIQLDPPEHTKHRANVQVLLTPSRVTDLDPYIRELTIELIEGFREKGECEFMSEFALHLPLLVFLRLMGLPAEDRLMLRDMVEKFLNSTDIQTRIEAHMEVHHYMEKWVAIRKADPKEDGLTHVINSTIDGRPYTDKEILSTLTLLLQAGLDTVANMLGFMQWHLARHPEDREYIRNNPGRMNNVVQELLRRFTGPQMARKLAKDYTYEGVTLKKGDLILLSPFFFNQDEEKFSAVDTVDFERDSRHITFGSGPHTCAGALLARREIATFLEEWLTRIPDFSLDPKRPPRIKAAQQNAVERLWLVWKP